MANDGSVSIEYSADLDEHTTIAASISANLDMSITAGYTITTNDGYDNMVSTSIELNHKQQNSPQKRPSTQQERIQVEVTDRGTELAIGLTLAAVLATLETFVTGGIGVWNDVPTWSMAIAAWGRLA